MAGEKLAALIARLQALPGAIVAARNDVAIEIVRVIRENIAAQRGPDEIPWVPGKQGEPVLQHAGDKVKSYVHGDVVTVELTGPEVLHHRGAAKGKIRRPILPSRRLPEAMKEALRRVIARRLKAGGA